jgi:hypothetical protein
LCLMLLILVVLLIYLLLCFPSSVAVFPCVACLILRSCPSSSRILLTSGVCRVGSAYLTHFCCPCSRVRCILLGWLASLVVFVVAVVCPVCPALVVALLGLCRCPCHPVDCFIRLACPFWRLLCSLRKKFLQWLLYSLFLLLQ